MNLGYTVVVLNHRDYCFETSEDFHGFVACWQIDYIQNFSWWVFVNLIALSACWSSARFFFLKNSMHLITRLRSLYGRIFSIGCLSNLWIMIVNSQVALCLELVLSKRIPEFGLYFLDDLVSQRSQAPKTCRVYPSFECRHFLRMYSVWGFLYPFRVLSGVEVTVFSSMTLYCKGLHCSVQFPSSLSNSGPQSGKTIQFSKLPCI